MACPYDILQLNRDADSEEINEAYRKLALLLHPQRCDSGESDGKSTKEMFVLLSCSYETLINPLTRRRYHSILSSLQDEKSMKSGMNTIHLIYDNTVSQCISPKLHEGNDSLSNERDDLHFVAMTRARDFRPFTDPYELFNANFGSDIFGTQEADSRDDEKVGSKLKNISHKFKSIGKMLRQRRIISRTNISRDERLANLDEAFRTEMKTDLNGNTRHIKKYSKVVGDKLMTRIETTIMKKMADGTISTEKIVEITREEVHENYGKLNEEENTKELKVVTQVRLLFERCNSCAIAPCVGSSEFQLSKVD